MKISKAAMKRLVQSAFFHEVEEIVKAWDFYLKQAETARGSDYDAEKGFKKLSDEMMHKWEIAKLALEYITGNVYGFSRNGNGNYSVVNERDYNDRIIAGFNQYRLP